MPERKRIHIYNCFEVDGGEFDGKRRMCHVLMDFKSGKMRGEIFTPYEDGDFTLGEWINFLFRSWGVENGRTHNAPDMLLVESMIIPRHWLTDLQELLKGYLVNTEVKPLLYSTPTELKDEFSKIRERAHEMIKSAKEPKTEKFAPIMEEVFREHNYGAIIKSGGRDD